VALFHIHIWRTSAVWYGPHKLLTNRRFNSRILIATGWRTQTSLRQPVSVSLFFACLPTVLRLNKGTSHCFLPCFLDKSIWRRINHLFLLQPRRASEEYDDQIFFLSQPVHKVSKHGAMHPVIVQLWLRSLHRPTQSLETCPEHFYRVLA
jgi:hypothetical protein